MRPRILVFASGSSEGGGSGFENLVHASRTDVLDADIAGVVSNHEHGGVRARADKLGIPFIYFSAPWTAEKYEQIAKNSGAEWFALSGWLKLVIGLDPTKTFNIHPGPLPRFGGPGLYGHHVHEAVMDAYQKGEVTHSAVSMHFVSQEYDKGPLFFERKVAIMPDDTADTLGKRVNECEHRYQPEITNLVVHGKISWDGADPASLVVPDGYSIHQ